MAGRSKKREVSAAQDSQAQSQDMGVEALHDLGCAPSESSSIGLSQYRGEGEGDDDGGVSETPEVSKIPEIAYDPRSLHDSLYNNSLHGENGGPAPRREVTYLETPDEHGAGYAPLSYISQKPLVSKIARINHEHEYTYTSQAPVLARLEQQSTPRREGMAGAGAVTDPSAPQEPNFYQRQIDLGEKPLDFSKYYVEGKTKPKCVDLYLTYNYRSQASILSAAYDVISKNTDVVRRPLLAKRQDIDLSQMVTLVDPNADALASAEAKNKIMETFQQRGALTHVSERRKRVVETLNPSKRLSTAEYHEEDGDFFKPEPPLSTMRPVIVHVPSVESEAQFVIHTIQDIQRLNEQSSIAVLYRTHYAVTKIEDELLRAEIPYRVVGAMSFFERKEIQDALAYMRLRVNPDDDMALRRVINVPSRRFGAKRMEMLERLARKGQCSLFQALLRNSDNEQLFARNKVDEFIQLILELNDAPLKDAAHDFELVMAKSGYEEWLKIQGEDERLDHLAELKKHVVDYVANQGENVNLADFLYSVMLLTDADDVNRNRREVQLMTVHCSKGLEFDYVFIVSANEAIFPSRQAVSSNNVDEERRLMYVAMTRARKQLIITEAGGCVYIYLPGTLLNSQSQTVKLERKPSRFLREIKQGHYAELGAHILEQKEAEANRHAHLQSDDTHAKNYQDALSASAQGGGMLTPQGLHKGFKFPEGAVVKHPVFGEGRIEGCNEQEGEYEIFFTQLNRRRNITAIVGNRNLTLVSLPTGFETATPQASQAPQPTPATQGGEKAAQSTHSAQDSETQAAKSDDYYTPENLPEMPSEFYEAEELAFSLDDPSSLNSN